MEKKKTKKKWREIRSAITMMCVMVAMLSTATYAWFTLSQNATVNGLQMTAKSSGGLQISENGTAWYSAIDLNDGINDNNTDQENIVVPELMPATLGSTTLTEVGSLGYIPEFKSPKYDSGVVTELESVTESNFSTYVVKKQYYLKNTNTEAVEVEIVTADPESVYDENGNLKKLELVQGIPNIAGSFVVMSKDTDGDENDNKAVEAVRVALVVTPDGKNVGNTNSTVIVWEPNYTGTDYANGSSFASDTTGVDMVTPKIVSDWDDGYFMTSSDGGTTWTAGTSKKSGKLFDLETEATVEMYVWFEGKDPQCVDQIMTDQIEVQIEFAAVTP